MNHPTKLTLLRICLIPFIVILSLFESPYSTWANLGVFLAASLTDWLDGYLARKHNQVTSLGKLLDPLADKLLVLTAFLVLVERGAIDAWLATLMIGREMAVTGLRAFLAAEKIILPASRTGKLKMGFQVAALSFLFVGSEHYSFSIVGNSCMVFALFFSIYSAVHYVRGFWKTLGDKIMAEQVGRDT